MLTFPFPTITNALDRCQKAVLALETTIFSSPSFDWDIARLSLKEQVDLRRFLRAKQHFLGNQDRVGELLTTALGNVFGASLASSQLEDRSGDAEFTVPLVTLMRKPGDLVDRIIGTICKQELTEAGLFTTLQQRLYENVCVASGVYPDDEKPRKPLITADISELPPAELVETYLKGTPFVDLIALPRPLCDPGKARSSTTGSWPHPAPVNRPPCNISSPAILSASLRARPRSW